MNVCGEARGQHWVFSSNVLQLTLQCLSLSVSLLIDSTSSLESPRSFTGPGIPGAQHCAQLCMWVLGTQVPNTCAANILLTEPSLQPTWLFIISIA